MSINSVYRNVGASILPQIVNVATNFILPAMIIAAYGSQINGLLATIKSMIGYVSLVGAGISISATQSLYGPVAYHNDDEVKGILKATSQMFNKSGWRYIYIVLILSLIYPITVSSDISYLTAALLVMIVSISGASEFFVVGTCRSLLFADRKTHVSYIIQATSLLISLICAVIMLKLQMSIIIVQLSISLVYIVRAVFLKMYVLKNYPFYMYDSYTIPITRAIEKRSDAMIHQLSGLAVWSSQTIILSLMVGLEAASVYSVYNIIYAGLMSICSNMNNAITPFIGRSLATQSINHTQSKYDNIEFVFHILSVFIYSVTAVMVVPFVVIYTKGADINYCYYNFALLFTFVHLLNIKRLPSNSLINAAGHFKETRRQAIIEAIICILCSVAFTYLWGIYGVLLGTLCAFCWRCLDIIVYSNTKILNIKSSRVIWRLVRAMIIVLMVYLLCYDISLDITINYRIWLINAIKVSALTCVILLIDILLFDRTSLKKLITILKRGI